MITKNDFDNWWNNPVGIEFRQMVKENLEKLAHGNMTNALTRDPIGNAQEVGKYMSNMFFYNLTYEQLTGEEPV